MPKKAIGSTPPEMRSRLPIYHNPPGAGAPWDNLGYPLRSYYKLPRQFVMLPRVNIKSFTANI